MHEPGAQASGHRGALTGCHSGGWAAGAGGLVGAAAHRLNALYLLLCAAQESSFVSMARLRYRKTIVLFRSRFGSAL